MARCDLDGRIVRDDVFVTVSPPAMEGTRTEEVGSDESSESKVERSIAVVRCAGCGRVLSGRVRTSERSPERRRGRRPRLPVLVRAP